MTLEGMGDFAMIYLLEFSDKIAMALAALFLVGLGIWIGIRFERKYAKKPDIQQIKNLLRWINSTTPDEKSLQLDQLVN